MKKTYSIFLSIIIFLGCIVFFSSCKKNEKHTSIYSIKAEYFPNEKVVEGNMNIDYFNNTTNAFDEIKFNLYPAAYRKDAKISPVSPSVAECVFYKGKSYGNIEILAVENVDKWEIKGEDKNILSVKLKEALFPDEKVEISISFKTYIPEINHRLGITEKTVNLCDFFPIVCGIYNEEFYECVYYPEGDPFYSECSDYIVCLTVPKDYIVASTGKNIEKKENQNKTNYTFTAKNVRNFAIVLSKEFKIKEIETRKTKIKYYYYEDNQPDLTLFSSKKAYDYFENIFGKLNQEIYSVVQTDFCYGGMEYPNLVLINKDLKKDEKTRTVVHETAHQWWYSAVGNNQVEHSWLDESLAEYSSLLFFEKHLEYGNTRETFVEEAENNYINYCKVYGQVFGHHDTRMDKSLREFISGYEYKSLVYDKGIIMLENLRKGLGDKRFLWGLRKYFNDYKFKIAYPDDLVGCFEKSGVDVKGLFESFLNGKSII